MDDLSKVTTKETAWELGYASGLRDAIKHGKWVHTEGNLYYCSVCLGYPSYIPTKCQILKYCPNCGAEMDKKISLEKI